MNPDINQIKQAWLYEGTAPDIQVLTNLMANLMPGRDRELARILLEITKGVPRLHDGETRHLLAARNQILLEKSLSRTV